jgi:hypothetical protein
MPTLLINFETLKRVKLQRTSGVEISPWDGCARRAPFRREILVGLLLVHETLRASLVPPQP